MSAIPPSSKCDPPTPPPSLAFVAATSPPRHAPEASAPASKSCNCTTSTGSPPHAPTNPSRNNTSSAPSAHCGCGPSRFALSGKGLTADDEAEQALCKPAIFRHPASPTTRRPIFLTQTLPLQRLTPIRV